MDQPGSQLSAGVVRHSFNHWVMGLWGFPSRGAQGSAAMKGKPRRTMTEDFFQLFSFSRGDCRTCLGLYRVQ